MLKPDYLAGKTAVVTGISKGVGKSLTLALLERGVSVFGWGLHAPAFAHAALQFIPCDVGNEGDVAAAAAHTLDKSPGVDFVVLNAGFGYFSPIEEFDVGEFRRLLDVNVMGAFLVTRALAPNLKARRTGHIVSISSIAGKVGAPQGAGYNASKYALTGMTECLFQELRKEGVKVTTVFPGATATHFFDSIPGFEAHDKMLNPDELAASLVHVLDTSPNYLIREIEIRPLTTK